jgi:hypothetical protein
MVEPVAEEAKVEETTNPEKPVEEKKDGKLTTTQVYGYNHFGMIYEW